MSAHFHNIPPARAAIALFSDTSVPDNNKIHPHAEKNNTGIEIALPGPCDAITPLPEPEISLLRQADHTK